MSGSKEYRSSPHSTAHEKDPPGMADNYVSPCIFSSDRQTSTVATVRRSPPYRITSPGSCRGGEFGRSRRSLPGQAKR